MLRLYNQAKSRIKQRLKDRLAGKELSAYESLLRRYAGGVRFASHWNFNTYKNLIISYVDSCKLSATVEYAFCESNREPSIYTATYALMLKGMFFGPQAGLSSSERNAFIDYFNSLQCCDTGYFIDPYLADGEYINPENREWWGYGHILLHVIICYAILETTPRHRFTFLSPFYDKKYLFDYLKTRCWGDRIAYTGNELMNLGVALQYSRDFLKDKLATVAITNMQQWLLNNINRETGLWGKIYKSDSHKISQSVQGAYHIWPIFFYDKKPLPVVEPAIDTILMTQNILGGYGCDHLQSTGCEDMDSIEPLYRFMRITSYKRRDVYRSLRFALPWVLANQNPDGGFVFAPNSPLSYGHKSLTSQPEESNLFATWWRCLSLVYLSNTIDLDSDFHLPRCPGMAFK